MLILFSEISMFCKKLIYHKNIPLNKIVFFYLFSKSLYLNVQSQLELQMLLNSKQWATQGSSQTFKTTIHLLIVPQTCEHLVRTASLATTDRRRR